ncbi:hypothetical protein BX600DRAFT_438732 [Xylariales sp. PMI_506]|nr:hypothetical protein BX600DRAFT_438732 [Xylariales sp. PMI_506]
MAIPPSKALDCLYSVPVDVQRDVELLDYILPYVESQSTLAFLKDPTINYLIPGVDLLGGIAEMREMLLNGSYTDQYDFATDLQGIFLRAKDGHLVYRPSIVSDVFSFAIPFSIVSLSEDGQALPKIYVQEDLTKLLAGAQFTPSDIVSINGIAVTDFIERTTFYTTYQDPDAMYNSLLNDPVALVDGDGHVFSNAYYDVLPDTLDVVFSNGTNETFSNLAYLATSFKNIDSGSDLHTVVEIPSYVATTAAAVVSSKAVSSAASTTAAAPVSVTTTEVSPTIAGYPWPVVKHSYDIVSGYFLNGTDYEDTAVLSVYAFESSQTNSTADDDEFRAVVAEFLAESKKAGKTKLVIDIQANNGGHVGNGMELFKQLFPDIDLYTPATARGTPFLYSILQAGGGLNALGAALQSNGLGYSSWDALFGPQVVTGGDNLTNAFQYNFTDASDDGFSYVISGYDGQPIPSSPFTAENIVILSDGQCSSTCTIFAGLATHLAGVRTIAYGGRPLNQPMQAVGGVKGQQELPWSQLQTFASVVRENNGGQIPADWSGTNFPSVHDAPLKPLLSSSSQAPGLNWKNSHLSFNDTTPTQFVYEAANCRQFYTLETWSNMTALWNSAADLAWNGAKCVPGSTINSDNTIGDTTLPYTDAVRASTNFYREGPGALPFPASGSSSSSSSSSSPTDSGSAKAASGTTTPVLGGAETRKVSSALGAFVMFAAVALTL